MASAPKLARKDPEATDAGLFRCAQCGSLFDTRGELCYHAESNNHPEYSDQEELDQAAGAGMIGEYDQLDGPSYREEKRH